MTSKDIKDFFPAATGIGEAEAVAAMDSPLLKLEEHPQFVGLGTGFRRPFTDWSVTVYVTDDPDTLTEAFRKAIPASIPSEKGDVPVHVDVVGELHAQQALKP